MRPDEVTVLDGIPITTWPRTIFDLASVLEDVALGRVIGEAESMQLTDRLSLPAILDRHCGERGAGRLRRVLESEHAAAGITRSELEERFVAFLLDAGLPMPELNASLVVDGRQMEVDCLWREEGVVVELIGLAFHGSRRRVERDTARNRRLLLARLPVVEVTWSQLHDPALRRELETDLRRLLSRGAGTSGRSAA